MPPASSVYASGHTFIGNDNPSAAITFAALPGQSGVRVTPAVEGMEFDVTDATVPVAPDNNAVNRPVLGGTVTGSGSSHAKVRWNGSNWTLMGV